jgi:G:T-mismatch repair DNA endonuclease (very short patch repair protein)
MAAHRLLALSINQGAWYLTDPLYSSIRSRMMAHIMRRTTVSQLAAREALSGLGIRFNGN